MSTRHFLSALCEPREEVIKFHSLPAATVSPLANEYKKCSFNSVRTNMSARTIGIRHQRKRTVGGAARPTQIAIYNGAKRPLVLDLEDTQAELDFVVGQLPLKWRVVEPDEDLEGVPERHIKWKNTKAKKNDKPEGVPDSHLRLEKGTWRQATKVASHYEGLRTGDSIAMVLGGSGDTFAAALTTRATRMGAAVYRISPHMLHDLRLDDDKDQDAHLLAQTLTQRPALFYRSRPREAAIVHVKERWDLLWQATQARIACEQRLHQQAVGKAFREAGDVDGGNAALEHAYDQLKANDETFQNLLAAERRCERELDKAVKRTDVWQKVFADVEGIGPRLAGRIIAAVGDIRRFIVEANPNQIAGSKARSDEIERRLDVQTLFAHVADEIAQDSDKSMWRKLRHLRKWLRTQSRHEEADQITRAIEEHELRAKLRQDALRISMGKFRKFCGLHVMPDGSFPRRRRGTRSSWNPLARQGMYLFVFDQCVKRKKSKWGQRFLHNKESYRNKHPHRMMVHRDLMPGLRRIERIFTNAGHPTLFWEEDLSFGTKQELWDYLKPHMEHLEDAERSAVCAELLATGVKAEEIHTLWRFTFDQNPPEDTHANHLAKDIFQGYGDEREERLQTLLGSYAVTNPGQTRATYSPGHLHKMAGWKTASEFCDCMFKQWVKLEQSHR